MKLLEGIYKKSFRKQKGDFLQKTALFILTLYRCYGSPFLGGNCRFSPSCSSYAQEAFQKLSFKKAFLKTLKRLSRCHPFSSRFGYDPLEGA